jgi:hypothetical protein
MYGDVTVFAGVLHISSSCYVQNAMIPKIDTKTCVTVSQCMVLGVESTCMGSLGIVT